MLNQKLFNLILQRVGSACNIRLDRDQEIRLPELMIVDLTAKVLEKKVRQGMGLFGPIRSPKREQRDEKRNAMLMEGYRCVISSSGRYHRVCPVIGVNVNEPNEKWETASFHLETRGTEILFTNIGFVPEPPAEEPKPEEPRRSGIRDQTVSNYAEFREQDFETLHLQHFIRMLDEATSEVLHMSIPVGEGMSPKSFINGQVVYNLREPNRMKAAHTVLAQGLNVITAQGDLTDLRVLSLTDRVSSLVFSGFYGTEVEWLQAHVVAPRCGPRDEFREREWGDATDEQVLYIEDMLSRLRNLG